MVAAKFNDLLQCLFRLAADIEGAVKRDIHAGSGVHHSPAGLHVNVAVRSQSAYHHAVSTSAAAGLDIFQHCPDFRFVIAEPALARSDKDIAQQFSPGSLYGIPHETE